MELPVDIYEKVTELSEIGSKAFDSSAFMSAISSWEAAKKLLPEPQEDWEAYMWLSASIGDAYFHLEQIEFAKSSFFDALNNIEGQSNPFVHYRLGQCFYKQGDEQKAIQSFLKAYMLDGKDIFSGKEGKKYLQLLQDKGLT